MKQTIFKRLGALLLALVMTLSLVPAALAADTVPENGSAAGEAGENTGEETPPAEGETQPPTEAPTEAPTVHVTRIDIVVPQRTLEVGGAATASADVYPSDATDKTFSWVSSRPEVLSIDQSGKLTALAPGRAEITAVAANEVSSEAVVVEVSGVTISEEALELFVGGTHQLTAGRFGAVSASLINWSTSNPSVAGVKDGKVSAYYPGTAVITAAAGSYSASCTVTVKEDVAEAIPREVRVGEVLSFSGLLSDLQYWAGEKIEAELAYITGLSVDTAAGVLYYGYTSPDAPGTGVGSTENYYVTPGAGQRKLTDLSFVPKADFGGTAVISYTGYGDGLSFTGTIRVQVENAGDVSYNTAKGRLLTFETADFASVCTTKIGGSLRYVTFRLPSAGRGTLYYDYSTAGQYSQKVSADAKYYAAGGSLLLGEVSFLPAEDYTGTVTIPYTAVNTGGSAYQGQVTILVFDGEGEDRAVIRCVTSGTAPVTFDAADFNEVCREAVGDSLNYVYFQLPDPADGALYHDYTSPTDYGSRVTASTRYFRSSDPRLSKVVFVPALSAGSLVEIAYTGYSTGGDLFQGTVRVDINGEGGDIAYATGRGEAVTFSGYDFNEACQASNGASLDSVSFTLPDDSQGVLYSNYRSGSSKGAKVTARGEYGISALSKIAFVPEDGFTGLVTIPFSGEDSAGAPFGGTVTITVGAATGSGTGQSALSDIYYQGGSLPIQFRAADFRAVCAGVLPQTLSCIRLDGLPNASCGKVLLNVTGDGLGTAAAAGVSYYGLGTPNIDTLRFVAKAGFTGTAVIPYTAEDIGGHTASGVIRVSVSGNAASAGFTDLSGYAWAAPAIAFLRDNGVTNGYGDGRFGPGDSISRGQFVVMLCRMFGFATQYAPGFADVPAGSYYAQPVMTARALGIVTGDGGAFRPDDPVTRQDAAVMLQRAMAIAGQSAYGAPAALLNAYSDGGTVSGYAMDAMAAMVQLGIIYGDDLGRLNPGKAVTRAEMAVLLHRAATL